MKRLPFVASLAAFAVLPHRAGASEIAQTLAELDARSGGRLGVYAKNVRTGATVAHRADERFLMCSTFKLTAVAALLHAVDRGVERFDRRVPIRGNAILAYAPVAKQHLARGSMTLREAAAAAMVWSDNTAANIVIAAVGGPAAVTASLRSIGDAVTRLDRTEPSLNDPPVDANDLRDTTSPSAMAHDLERFLFGNVLSANSRRQLRAWMQQSKTGPTLLRAGFPSDVSVGDKSGMGGAHNAHGDSDTRNDVAFASLNGGSPVVVASYLTGSTLSGPQRDGIHAAVARAVFPLLSS